MPRLPRSLVVIGVLCLLLAGAGQEILRLRAALAARPGVKDRIITRVVQGPTRIEVRTITKPGGETIVERVRTVESRVVDRDAAHQETPVCGAPKTRYVGLAVDPLDARRPRLRGGLTLWDRVDVGAAYDSRFAPANGAFQLEVSYRF